MNQTEKKMVALLRQGAESYGVLGVKAEFEAEGTRTDEMLRLLDIARRAGVRVALKIGGAEAMRDLYDSKMLGVDYLIAPMIESAYALQKFIDAKNKIYGASADDCEFLFNLETISAYRVLPELIATARQPQGAAGIVFGRVDFAGSLALGRQGLLAEPVCSAIMATSAACQAAGLSLVVGGGVAAESLNFLASVQQKFLSRYETRKIIFAGSTLANQPQATAGLELAIAFELLWLTNKRDHYRELAAEDEARIAMLEKRLANSSQQFLQVAA